MVERALALDGAIGEAHRERAVARIERGGLGGERAIGVRALLEHTPQDGVGAAAGGGPAVAVGTEGIIGYPPRPASAGASTSATSPARRAASASVSVAVVTRIPRCPPASR